MIDALDECADRVKTLNWAQKLISDNASNLHIVITSRPEEDIHEIFAALDPHSIDVGEANTMDIVEYIKLYMESKFTTCDEITQAKIMSGLEEQRRIVCFFSPTIRSILADPLMRFRWVALQVTTR